MPVATERAVFDRHVAAWAQGDVDALMADWSEDGILIDVSGIFMGSSRIRGHYGELLARRGEMSMAEPPELVDSRLDGCVGWTRWHDGDDRGHLDLVLIQGGKKVAQTSAENMPAPRRSILPGLDAAMSLWPVPSIRST